MLRSYRDLGALHPVVVGYAVMCALGIALAVVSSQHVWLYLVGALELTQLLLGGHRYVFLVNQLVLQGGDGHLLRGEH